ncbi:hypothetical protein [Pontibacter sp. SGAir0037]|uniref:hypothetical protein n=1 Tax=Pontibacter sp. SGAir0037 TaxID=2571030 RepID=UPI0010CD6254|nr:hypothetical protein [Pontibacter sp. SGAir0037]QCR23903.1 hypothetical protein C1N53_17135 [Pontibacter sp. SGAir0037]
MKNFTSAKLGLTMLMASVILSGCKDDDIVSIEEPMVEWNDTDYSVTPSLVRTLPGFESIRIKTLISSDDVLEQSPGFVYGAQPDGGGIMRNPNGEGFIMVTNHEILQSVSRVYLDKTFKPVKGEYIVDGAGGMWRLCSATLATPEEHGFGPIFLTAGESGVESMIHAINPLGNVSEKSRTDRTLPALGKCSAENAVPLPKTAYNGKTVIFIGEDESNPANSMGQVNMYVSNTVGDLQNGKLYMLRRKDKNTVETDMQVGQSYEVEFVEYTNVSSSTGAQLAAQTVEKNAIQFARVEDLDYGKGSATANRVLYFVSTGVSPDKINPAPGFTMWGRLYKLELDANSPLSGKITPLLDGNSDPGKSLVNPDNLCVTENYVYIQEDGDSFYQATSHDGRIWQYDIRSKALKPMLEMNHRRTDATFNAKYNPSNDARLSSWEYGAMFDVSDLVGKPGTFVVNIHPHTWRHSKFLNADGSGLSSNNEGGQTVILTNVPR